jgi:GT2 family glycosyltransferase
MRTSKPATPPMRSIVVTQNAVPWLDRCLGSLADAGVPLRITVVDNASNDGTPERIARSYPGVELVALPTNVGFGAANNIGLGTALQEGAEFVLLLNQDAWVLPDTLPLLVAAAAAAPDYGVLSQLHLNGSGLALDAKFANYIVPASCPGLLSDLALRRASGVYPVRFVNAAAWLLTRRCLETVGGFSPTFFHYGEDDNYVARVRFHGLTIGIVPEARAYHDRAERPPDPRFHSEEAGRLRAIRLHYSDPAGNGDPRTDRRRFRRRVVQNLLSPCAIHQRPVHWA